MENGARGALGSLLDELALETGNSHKRRRDPLARRTPSSAAPAPEPTFVPEPVRAFVPETSEPVASGQSGWLLTAWGVELGFLLGKRPAPVRAPEPATASRTRQDPDERTDSAPSSPLLAPWGQFLGLLSGKRALPLTAPRARSGARRSPGLTVGEFLETSQWD